MSDPQEPSGSTTLAPPSTTEYSREATHAKKKRRVRLGPLRLPVWVFVLVVVALIGGIAGIVLGGGGDSVSGATKADGLIAEGVAAQNAGNLDEASAKYTAAIEANPASGRAHYDLGTVFQAQNNSASAITEFQEAVKLDPTIAAAYYNLGILFTTSDPNQAVGYYRSAVLADPTNASAHLNLGFLLRSLGQNDEGNQQIALASSLQQSSSTTTPGDETTTTVGGGPTTVPGGPTTVAGGTAQSTTTTAKP